SSLKPDAPRSWIRMTAARTNNAAIAATLRRRRSGTGARIEARESSREGAVAGTVCSLRSNGRHPGRGGPNADQKILYGLDGSHESTDMNGRGGWCRPPRRGAARSRMPPWHRQGPTHVRVAYERRAPLRDRRRSDPRVDDESPPPGPPIHAPS